MSSQRIKTLLSLLILIISFTFYGQQTQKFLANEIGNSLFSQGDNGYGCFRIPTVIIGNEGRILVFAEARKSGCSDTGNIDLVMRKSDDNGLTWSPLKIIWDDGNNVCGNPAPVLDKETGTIHLLSTWNNGQDHESQIIAGTSIDSREIYHLFSKDNGRTWSSPKNITPSVKLPNWTWYATGPVHGIQLVKGPYKGRLLIPCDHIEKDSKKYYSHAIFSDDHGLTWQLGKSTPNDKVNECTAVELDDSSILLNMRNYGRDKILGRQSAQSLDGGVTWQNQRVEGQLPEPVCQGALLKVNRNDQSILLFSNPSHKTQRLNMSITLSMDQGKTWNEKITIYDAHAAYSDLAEVSKGQIMVVYEAGLNNPYEGIYYKIVKLNP